MRIEFLRSFEKSLKNLHLRDKNEVCDACETLIQTIQGEIKTGKGLGLKRLKKNFWEVRVSIKIRIIFRWQKDLLQFILAGSHDDIKKYLKENV